MRESFRAQAANILGNPGRFSKPPGILRVGLEMEAGLVGRCGEQIVEGVRNRIIEPLEFADMELGGSQLEWRTEPIILNEAGGVSAMASQALERDAAVRGHAAMHDVSVLRSGSNPFIAVPAIVRTDKPKYRQVPDFHNRERRRENTVIGVTEQVDVGDAAVVALLSSLQCNVEAEGLDDAVDLLNRSLMIGPEVVAISGNARLLEGADTGLADLRMSAWETSHDTRTAQERMQGKDQRVGLPARYIRDMEDYFAQIEERPFILFNPDNALRIGIGLNWQDTRIKIIGESAVVEFRPVSIQPSAAEDVAVMLFYLGRLAFSKHHEEPLMPMEQVRSRRDVAMSKGIAPYLAELPGRLQQAKMGLEEAGILDAEIEPFFSLLEARIAQGKAPSDIAAQKFAALMRETGGDRTAALIQTFNNLV